MAVTIYHNPRCSKSRETLALIREAGVEPDVVEYLKKPPLRERIAELLAAMDVPACDLIRWSEAACKELGLANEQDEERLIDAMAGNPILIERPIVVTPKGVRVCRPPESVREIL